MPPQVLPTYSFADVHASLVGPSLAAILADGSGSAEEGINWEPLSERDIMTIGAGGDGMHTLNPSRAGRIMIRLLKTSPTNAILQQAFNYQSSSSLFWGKNLFHLTNPITGDSLSASGAAFDRQPPNSWGLNAAGLEWTLNAIYVSQTLGGLSI